MSTPEPATDVQVDVQPDTKAFMKQIHLAPGVYGNLREQRFALRTDIQQVNYITRRDFINDVLPQSYIAQFPDIDLIITRLKEDSALTGDGNWTDFPPEAPDDKEGEVKRYARLVKIVTAITQAATTVSKAASAVSTATNQSHWTPLLLEYVNNGNGTPESVLRSNSSRPDGFFLLKNRANAEAAPKVVRWYDIAVVAEFKKKNDIDGVEDNVDKMLWGMNHIMRDDPCRDFVYGFSIEDTSMKLWYCDRSNTVISDEFDIHTDHRKLVIFCLSMLCASLVELGWDASTERCEPAKQKTVEPKGKKAKVDPDEPTASGQPRYILTVRVDEQVSRRFITISPISILGADGILGRGTRVWKARELVAGEESGEEVAIKDYWIDDDRMREGDVVQKILDAAPAGARRNKLKNYIVDILCHGDVHREHTSVVKGNDGQPKTVKTMVLDSTRDLKEAIKRRNRVIDLQRPKAPPSSIPSQTKQLANGTHTPVPPSSYLTTTLRKGRPLPGVRTRNRLVMTQVGIPLHTERSLLSVFRGLRDVSIGLDMIHNYGWVHRDVSTGNIILWHGKGILSDFEYAKRIPRKGEAMTAALAHPGRTGTPHFMSIEVQRGAYLFLSNVGESVDVNMEREPSRPSSPSSSRSPSRSPSRPPSELPSVQPHPLAVTPDEGISPDPSINPLKRRRGRKSEGPDGAMPEEYPGQASGVNPTPDLRSGLLLAFEKVHEATPVEPKDPFIYNPMHDFETLIWIGTCFIFNRVVDEEVQQQLPEDLAAQREYARLLFSGDVVHRRAVFDDMLTNRISEFDENVQRLHPSVRRIGTIMANWIRMQKATYQELEKSAATIFSANIIFCLKQVVEPYLKGILEILKEQDINVTNFSTEPKKAAAATNDFPRDVVNVPQASTDPNQVAQDVDLPAVSEASRGAVVSKSDDQSGTTSRSTRPAAKKMKT